MGRASKALLLCLLMAVAPFAGCFGSDDETIEEVYVWIDPVTEIEDGIFEADFAGQASSRGIGF